VQDPDGDGVAVAVTGITEGQPLRHPPCGDAAGIGATSAALRAVRGPHGEARVYRVSFEAADGRGGRCTGAVLACVSSGGSACTRDGTGVDATAPGCTGMCASMCNAERTLGAAICAQAMPTKLGRSIEQARRNMVRAAGGKDARRWIAAGLRNIKRAERLAARASKAGALSSTCLDTIDGVLSRAHEEADRGLAPPAAPAPTRPARSTPAARGHRRSPADG
jgi:hypothetical protein